MNLPDDIDALFGGEENGLYADADASLDEEASLYEHFRIVVDKGQELLRIDKFLLDHLPHVSRNRIQKAAEVLVFSDFKTLIKTCRDSYDYFSSKGYKKFYCGHFFGVNFETLERIQLIQTMAEEALAGKIDGEPTDGFGNMNTVITRDGFRLNYNDLELKKERLAQ